MSLRYAAGRSRIVESLWRLLAAFLARTAVREVLIQHAKRHPFMHLQGYMNRYWIVPQAWRLPFSIRVHHILREDADPYLHDHPWNWRTVILRGWYEEEDVFGERLIRLEGDTRRATAETFHRITRVSSGGVWTLFIMGRWRNRWGFMTGFPARKVYYRDYQSENGRGELEPQS